jgi:hypothetical protein
MWVRARDKEENKEKCVNRAIFPDKKFPTASSHRCRQLNRKS